MKTNHFHSLSLSVIVMVDTFLLTMTSLSVVDSATLKYWSPSNALSSTMKILTHSVALSVDPELKVKFIYTLKKSEGELAAN